MPQLFYILAFFFSFFPLASLAASPKILVSEIQIAGEKADDEFVELYNPSDKTVDISGWQLRKRTASGNESSLKVFEKGSSIAAHDFFLWGNSKGKYAKPISDVETGTSLSENNSLALYTDSGSKGELVDTLAWGTGSPFVSTSSIVSNPKKNESLTRDFLTPSWNISTSSTPQKSTPPAPDPEPTPLPPVASSPFTIRFNEILPDPKTGEEYIELFNEGEKTFNLENFTLKDVSKTGAYTFPKNSLILAHDFLVLFKKTFGFALNNSNETLSLLDPSGTEVTTLNYTKTKKGISLNYFQGLWRGSHFLTPGAENILNNLPETKEKVPKKGYRGIAVSFDARGKDSDGEKLKFTWNFGDGHKSYKEKTSHIYKESGQYSVSLTTTDGNEDTLETFSLSIEDFFAAKVRMRSLIPNPKGKDSENEWILFENLSKKNVNLKGYSVATGWKKLINHPIRADFVLAPKEQRKLTREYSLFTLPNQKGKIEFRAPDGKVLQELRYKHDAAIAENTLLKKEKGRRWEWEEHKETATIAALPTKKTLLSAAPNPPQPTVMSTEIKAAQNLSSVKTITVISSENDEWKAYQKLLNYGTSVKLPKSITLSFHDAPPIEENTALSEPSSSSSLFEKINTYLNTWQNID